MNARCPRCGSYMIHLSGEGSYGLADQADSKKFSWNLAAQCLERDCFDVFEIRIQNGAVRRPGGSVTHAGVFVTSVAP